MYAEVLIQYGVKSLDRTFTYLIPDKLKDIITVGKKVKIPFGKQTINGFVTNITNNKPDIEVKEIIDVINKDVVLDEELLSLGSYIVERTLCSKITAYQTMLPTSLKISNNKESYALNKTYIILNKSDEEIDKYINENKRAIKQIEILNKLKNEEILKNELSASAVNILLKKGLVKEKYVSIYRLNYDKERSSLHTLSLEQQEVYESIKNNLNTYNTYLLYGVTGSGKTEVYMHLVRDVINMNKTVMVLVPEISLTTQIIKRFYMAFGSDVAIIHSNLSDGEKYDEYNKISRGEVHIVVGTRSSVFAPLKNIGLIIIDEEHSSNYKQENNPRYHAKDMAIFRAKYHNCPVVLGSATPSLDSMARASKGVYKLLVLNNRVGEANLPKISIIDMQAEYKKRNMILSDELSIKIMETLEKHEQIMLLLNRRGFSTIITCSCCGYTYKCPNCDITLTYHKTSNNLRCHYCGYTVLKSDNCPSCHERALEYFGLGTEKVEKFIREQYPSARVVRMDADTTSKKGEHERIINAIEDQKYDIIIGTQMISKGFDFPNVTLVGIINADESLNIPDFRSGENTYSLLSQVSGRAGRSNKAGRVIIQTFNPDNKTLNYVKNNDYMGNYNYEMSIRKKLKYPPYYYITSLKVTGKKYEDVSKEAIKVANYLKNNIENSSIVLGPTTASMFKINNIYRFQIIIKYRFDDKLNKVIQEIDNIYKSNNSINIEIDIDPLRI